MDRVVRPALRSVPHPDECTVRINLATVHEAVGDAASGDKDVAAARTAYQAGRKALADGRCTTEAGRGAAQTQEAKGDDERLAKKLEEKPDDQPAHTPTDTPTTTPPPEPDQPPTDKQQEDLRKANQSGQDSRQDSKELDGKPPDDSRDYHW